MIAGRKGGALWNRLRQLALMEESGSPPAEASDSRGATVAALEWTGPRGKGDTRGP